ncbi:MAG: DUF6784 domain-containing protein [Armatimonadota bacterium]
MHCGWDGCEASHLVATQSIGLVMARTYAMGGIYFSVFLGWLIRWSCVRLGGLHSYRRFLPFFPGLLRGEAL